MGNPRDYEWGIQWFYFNRVAVAFERADGIWLRIVLRAGSQGGGVSLGLRRNLARKIL